MLDLVVTGANAAERAAERGSSPPPDSALLNGGSPHHHSPSSHTVHHCNPQGRRFVSFRAASDIYLTEEEYEQVTVPWLEDRPDAYRALCHLWATPEWIAKSIKSRECGGFTGGHRYGPDGHLRMAKRMEAETGIEPSPIDVYVRGHRPHGPSQPNQLCTAVASDRLEKYKQEVVKRHGDDYDWHNEPIDNVAVHASGGGKAHGRYPIFNGLVDSREARTSRRSSSQTSSSSHRTTEKDIEIARLREELKQHEERAKAQQEYLATYNTQMQTALQALIQGQNNITIPAWQPPTAPTTHFSPAAQGTSSPVVCPSSKESNISHPCFSIFQSPVLLMASLLIVFLKGCTFIGLLLMFVLGSLHTNNGTLYTY